MTDVVERILQRYESQGFDKIVKEQQTLAAGYEKAAKAQDKVNTSAQNLGGKFQKLESFGRNLRQAGGFLGNDTLMALGSWADGLADVGQSIDSVANKGNKLGKIVGIGGAVIGGAGLGAAVYNATIGQLQGTNTEIILSQIGQLIKAGFNVETLRVQAQQAMILAQNSQYGYENKLQATSNTLVREGIFTPQEAGALGGGLDIERLKEQQAKYKQILADLESGKMLEGPEMFLGKAQTRLKAIEDAISILETQMANSPLTKAKTAAWSDALSRMSTTRTAGVNLLAAGQTFQQRQGGAENVYQLSLYNIEQETGRKRAEIARQYSTTLAEIDANYYEQRQKAATDFAAETQKAQADFARQQQQAAEDYAQQQRRASEDHQDRLKKLIESRDALAVEDENDAYRKEQQRAEEDFNEQQQRAAEEFAAAQQQRRADFDNQMRELDRAHQEQRAERQRAYQEQLRDLAAQAEQKRQMEQAQYAILLRDILKTFNDARNAWASAVTNNTNNTTNKTANTNVNIAAGGMSAFSIQNAVYGAITEAFR